MVLIFEREIQEMFINLLYEPTFAFTSAMSCPLKKSNFLIFFPFSSVKLSVMCILSASNPKVQVDVQVINYYEILIGLQAKE